MHVSRVYYYYSIERTNLKVGVGLKLNRVCKLHYKNRDHKVIT